MSNLKPPVSYYEILGVTADANDGEIRRAFRRMAIKFHPDHNPQGSKTSQNHLHQITKAYAKIKTQKKRTYYNEWLQAQKKSWNAANNNTSQNSWLTQVSKLFKSSES